MGDFNFNNKTVKWVRGGDGLVPDYAPGELEQIVDQPTRGKSTLDLIFTSKPHLFGACSTKILKPVSDHHLVCFEMSNPSS